MHALFAGWRYEPTNCNSVAQSAMLWKEKKEKKLSLLSHSIGFSLAGLCAIHWKNGIEKKRESEQKNDFFFFFK